jgi:FKBP-type peptidyl-prolyl cis-trans isomerase FkpA|tara:strand:+ start:355 stop:801 length:447 start_codon:yes stop_codon:yes gene_type:complete
MSVFLKNSAIRNKSRVQSEQVLINKARKLDTKNTYKDSNLGFLFSVKDQKSKSVFAKRGDFVEVKYKIEDLNQNLLYGEDDLQTVKFIVDKEEIIPALREGVKFLSEGDTGIFLFPSHFCYGYQGDSEKIGPNQPLRFIIKLVSLSNN